MSERKNIVIMIGFVLAASLMAASFSAFLAANYYSRMHIRVLGQLYEDIIEIQPESEPALMTALKEFLANHENDHELTADENIILRYGYSQSDFLTYPSGQLFAVAGFLAGGLVFAAALFLWHRKDTERIKALTEYLEKVNTGNNGVLLQAGEDDFSKLQDEIYKTVTTLYQTRDEALKAKDNFAENLYNIAHQIKTPITSIVLSVQMMKEALSSMNLEEICMQFSSMTYLEEIRGQLFRLTHLEEALLLLSRIDAGTLSLDRKEVDVFTVLMLATDNLQELFSKANVSVNIPESGAMIIHADPDWTMEAIMNLLKNCMEHTPPGGAVHCSYEQNPLYTQVRIWDTGEGFAREDIPHLFERFYRGKGAKSGGIGIGLAFSKAIIESQNGTVSARNLAGGGACFEIRFYSH